MAFTQKDLVDLCRQVVMSADILDRAAAMKTSLPAIEARSEQAKKELADTLGMIEAAKQTHDASRQNHQAEIDALRAERTLQQAGLEADRRARIQAKQDGQAALLQSHGTLANDLRNQRDALIAEIDSLRKQRAELQRALRDARENIKV